MNRTQVAGTLYKEIAPGLPKLDSLVFKPFEDNYKRPFARHPFSQQRVPHPPAQATRGKPCFPREPPSSTSCAALS